MLVEVKRLSLKDVYVAHVVCRKVERLLKMKVPYLFEESPEVNFYMHEDGLELLEIYFENKDNFDRLVIRNKAMWIQFFEGGTVVLAQYDNFKDIVKLSDGDLWGFSDDIQAEIDKKNSNSFVN